MTKQIILKVPEGMRRLTLKVPTHRKDSKNTKALMHTLLALADFYGLAFEFTLGESISPICVSGDLDLELAEEIKQRALVHVRKWEEGTK